MAVDPKKDPARRCMLLGEWPACDQEAWARAIAPGDALDPGGPASHWSPYTQMQTLKSYGRWLTWLQRRGLLGDDSALPLTTRAHVRAYMAELSTVNGATTVAARISQLAQAARVMAPEADWQWLARLGWRLHHGAAPVRDKRTRVRPTRELFALGLTLMHEATTGEMGALARAVRFRDGLLIAFLAARPLRRRNLAMIALGRHLVRIGTAHWVVFKANETKTRRPIEDPIPAELEPLLETYLHVHRPVLLRNPSSDLAGLWISKDGTKMREISLYFRIRKITQARLGYVLPPHMFRDCAATSVAIEDPAHVKIILAILGHGSLRTARKHYIQARTIEASRRFQSFLLDKRKSWRRLDQAITRR